MMTDEQIRKLRRLGRVADRAAVKPVPILTGTYVPTYVGGTTAGVTTYVTQIGHWTRIGRLLFYQGRLEWSAATGTGNAQFSLPFTAVNTANLFCSGSIDNTNVTFANGTPQVLIQPNTAFFLLRSPITNAASAVVQIEAAGIVNFSGFYEVT